VAARAVVDDNEVVEVDISALISLRRPANTVRSEPVGQVSAWPGGAVLRHFLDGTDYVTAIR
jgi:hypothetical protein